METRSWAETWLTGGLGRWHSLEELMDHLARLVDLLHHLHCRLLAPHLPSRALRGLKISRQITRKREPPVTHLLLDL